MFLNCTTLLIKPRSRGSVHEFTLFLVFINDICDAVLDLNVTNNYLQVMGKYLEYLNYLIDEVVSNFVLMPRYMVMSLNFLLDCFLSTAFMAMTGSDFSIKR
jgi:hypothetical protein